VLTAIVAALGALIFNAVSATATGRQIELSRQAQLSDRYARAVEQLGSEAIDVRLGGIYALERLMRDSPGDQPTIVEVLAAFIRDNANHRPAPSPIPTPTSSPDPRVILAQRPTDLVAAITVLGRRDTRQDAPHTIVDLSHTDLAGLNLSELNLAHVNPLAARLHGAILSGANLSRASLLFADLTDARLNFANLTCAYVVGADLRAADLSSANLAWAGLTGANLTGANLADANITHTDLTDAKLDGVAGTPRPPTTPDPRYPC
jgi:hypothetical protein